MTIFIFFFVAAVINAAFWWQGRQRAFALRQLASKLGFAFLGAALPRSLSLRGTGLEGVTSCWNVMDGELNDARVVIFDCRVGQGKGSWRRTVIAAKSEEIFKNVPIGLDLKSEPAGDWTLLYQPKTYLIIPPGLIAVPEIVSLLELFHSVTQTGS